MRLEYVIVGLYRRQLGPKAAVNIWWISGSCPCSCVYRRSVACWCQIQVLNLFLFLLYLTWNNYLFVLYRENRSLSLCRHAVAWVMTVAFVYTDPRSSNWQAWHSRRTKQYWTNSKFQFPISIRDLRMLFVAERSIFWKRSSNARFWTHFSWFILVTRASDLMAAHDPRLWETRWSLAKIWLFGPHGACS